MATKRSTTAPTTSDVQKAIADAIRLAACFDATSDPNVDKRSLRILLRIVAAVKEHQADLGRRRSIDAFARLVPKVAEHYKAFRKDGTMTLDQLRARLAKEVRGLPLSDRERTLDRLTRKLTRDEIRGGGAYKTRGPIDCAANRIGKAAPAHGRILKYYRAGQKKRRGYLITRGPSVKISPFKHPLPIAFGESPSPAAVDAYATSALRERRKPVKLSVAISGSEPNE